ncbi:MAG: hypothetical protein M0R03_18395 [Novosphingobium sp.]|nr:hypothetical protein [Novosphingobium sp.]
MTTKRRALVLTDESARHPFRRLLPPHVRQPLSDGGGQGAGPAGLLGLSRTDWRDVGATWCACFLAVSLFFM